jgi:hypothetical protein
MANRFDLPLQTPVDATGAPYPGGKLFFYESGSTTKLNTYSDESLTIANSNPVVLDSAGRFPNAIFLQNLPYKVVLAPSTDSDPPTAPIWTQDPVYASDYSTVAQFQPSNGSPNGQLAGTAASATIPASAAWDYVNNILYVCTTTGTDTTAVWTAVNASSAAAVVPAPQGYLTPVSNTPIITTDSTAATTIYYTPYIGVLVPLYNGSSFVPTSIVSELQYTLTSNLVANNIYDCYVFSLLGVPTLGTGPSWSAGTSGSITAGSCARGTGAGGAAISRVQGIWTNTASMTIRYGNGTTTTVVDANKATYVGSIFIDSSNGQVSCYRTYGPSRKWGIWNAYNRAPVYLKAGPSSNWNYGNPTVREAGGLTTNIVTLFSGLAEDTCDVRIVESADFAGTSGAIGIGYNSTTAFAGQQGVWNFAVGTFRTVQYGSFLGPPALGINVVAGLESISSGSVNFLAGESNWVLSASWRA